ncbi:protein of unknown function (plasmid) [Pararobbsia alpina]
MVSAEADLRRTVVKSHLAARELRAVRCEKVGAARVSSPRSGSLILGAAGVLRGRRAARHAPRGAT